MPVFGGGTSRFQPVFVGDVARAVEIISRDDVTIRQSIDGKTMEAGGPDGVFILKLFKSFVLIINQTHASFNLQRSDRTRTEVYRSKKTYHFSSILGRQESRNDPRKVANKPTYHY